MYNMHNSSHTGFQSTHPVWGATRLRRSVGLDDRNFNPRTPCGVRPITARIFFHNRNFNPRTPCGVRPSHNELIHLVVQISIHAPRVGCDSHGLVPMPRCSDFNPRTPCGVRLRGRNSPVLVRNFNPRTPCGVRPFIANEVLSLVEFQSTHPVWGATACVGHKLTGGMISIHAPRVGCDWYACNQNWGGDYFNPRTPCGVRHKALSGTNKEIKFQSTHPVWGATPMTTTGATPAWDFNPRTPCGVRLESLGAGRGVRYISIHAPRVGCDNQHVHQAQMEQHFNPRTPCGVRLHGLRHRLTRKIFQSTHPVWGATTPDTLISRPVSFQSTHPVWGATPGSPFFPGLPLFQSTHPVWGATCPPRPNSE